MNGEELVLYRLNELKAGQEEMMKLITELRLSDEKIRSEAKDTSMKVAVLFSVVISSVTAAGASLLKKFGVE